MWSRDALVPHRIATVALWLFVSLAAWAAALVAWWMLLLLSVPLGGSGWLLGATLVHWDAMVLVAAASGAVIGAAAMSGRSSRQRLTRFLAASALMAGALLAVVGAFMLAARAESRDFSAPAFRAALAAEDYEAVADQASRAVASGELIGLSPAALERTLGRPDRVGHAHNLYVWHVGMIDDFLGPGDAGNLYVRFDPAWREVRAAAVATSWRRADE